MRTPVNHLAPLVLCRQGLTLGRAEYDGHIQPLGELLGNLIVVAFRTAKGKVIVRGNVTAVRMLCIIIEPHTAEQFHHITGTPHLYRFPADIARQVETEGRLELQAVSPTQGGFNFLHHIGKEELAGFKESLRLGDAGFLRAGKLPMAARVETGFGAPIGRTGARLVAANGVRGEVQAETEEAQLQSLFQLGVAFGKHLTFPRRWK